MMWWDDEGWGSGRWLVMTLMMLIFLGALIAFGMWAVHSLKGNPPAAQPSTTTAPIPSHAHEVLAERYARGEIDENEFARRRALLHAPPP